MRKLFLLLICATLMVTPTEAKSKKSKKKDKEAATAAAKIAEAKKSEGKPDIYRHGLFNVFKQKGEWYFEMPDSMLGKDLLTTTRFVSTPPNSDKYGGEMCNEQVVYFQLNQDSTVLLRTKMFVNMADSTDAISKAVTVSNESSIIAAFKMEKRRNGLLRFKVTNFLNDDNALGIRSGMRESFGLGQIAKDLCFIEDIKSFPTNTEVRLVKTYNSTKKALPPTNTTGKVTFVLNVSFILLPQEPMLPRYYDPRVGYFTNSFREYNDEQQRVESKRFVARWRLEPRPEDVEKMQRGELVEPMKPIVYYIDPATPKQWRKYLIQGVNDWQAAFEKAGFKNAIVGKEWPEDNDSTMSMEDARYSVIRYLAAPVENAYGPHVSDPRTGEILESHIGWYHNVMSLLHDWYMVQASSVDEAARKMHFDEELMGQLIRFVASHEVGHTLGLRHNFGSSSTVSVDSLRNKAWVEAHGHTPSIMDYARFNYVAQPEDNIASVGIFPRIGDYDMWAIEWGYRPMPEADNPDTDHQMLEDLTQKAQENKRLWWGDGEGESNDPRRQTEDLGDDAVKASEYGILNLKRELIALDGWTLDDKDIYGQNLPYMYNMIVKQFRRYIGHVAHYIGGTYINYRTRQQGGTLYEPTPLEKQKAALDFLDQNILQEPVWLRETNYAKSLNKDPNNLTLPLATHAVSTLISRIDNLNDLYPADEYMSDIVRLIYVETQTNKPVTKYREALQNAMTNELVRLFNNNASDKRAVALQTLKEVQKRTQSYHGSDSHSKAHFASLADLITRTLTIK